MIILSFNPIMSSGLLYLKSLDCSISNRRGVWLVFISTIFIEIPVFSANSVYPSQAQRSLASDLVYTVCKWLCYGTLGVNGLIEELTSVGRFISFKSSMPYRMNLYARCAHSFLLGRCFFKMEGKYFQLPVLSLWGVYILAKVNKCPFRRRCFGTIPKKGTLPKKGLF